MISANLLIWAILFILFLFCVIVYLLRNKRISMKYALVWILAIAIILFVLMLPSLMYRLASLFGFELLSNMILCVFIGILLFITLALTVMVSGQKKKITLLIQEVSILKKEVEDK